VFTIVWEFRVPASRRAEFERFYGPHGDWAALFAQAAGFVETELLRDAYDPLRYLTIDRWTSATAHADFLSRFGVEYAELDARCAELAVQETLVGRFVGAIH
jgi:heme-degrading monooxygenase HmoA